MVILIDPIDLLSVLMTVAFIVLRLCGIIDLSWFWCVSPMFIPIIAAVVSGILKAITNEIDKGLEEKDEE